MVRSRLKIFNVFYFVQIHSIVIIQLLYIFCICEEILFLDDDGCLVWREFSLAVNSLLFRNFEGLWWLVCASDYVAARCILIRGATLAFVSTDIYIGILLLLNLLRMVSFLVWSSYLTCAHLAVTPPFLSGIFILFAAKFSRWDLCYSAILSV